MVAFADVTPTPDIFAVVMATGILSIAARDHDYFQIGDTLGVLASLGLLVLVALVAAAVARNRGKIFWDLADPDVTLRLFTFVAACAVLDSRLTSEPAVAHVLGVIALLAWLVLIVFTARNMSRCSWTALRDRAHGAWELGSVGTFGLAIVTAAGTRHTGERWWLVVAVAAWAAAIGGYALMTWLILWRAVAARQDRDGFEPDTWILMGALAIATLAGDDIHQLTSGWLVGWVRAATVLTWVAATLWIPPLIYFGLYRISGRPEMLQFAGVWWTLVFPLGMYSAATHAMAAEIGRSWMQTISLVLFWDAFAVWAIVVIAGLLRIRHVVRG